MALIFACRLPTHPQCIATFNNYTASTQRLPADVSHRHVIATKLQLGSRSTQVRIRVRLDGLDLDFERVVDSDSDLNVEDWIE